MKFCGDNTVVKVPLDYKKFDHQWPKEMFNVYLNAV